VALRGASWHFVALRGQTRRVALVPACVHNLFQAINSAACPLRSFLMGIASNNERGGKLADPVDRDDNVAGSLKKNQSLN